MTETIVVRTRFIRDTRPVATSELRHTVAVEQIGAHPSTGVHVPYRREVAYPFAVAISEALGTSWDFVSKREHGYTGGSPDTYWTIVRD